MQALITRGREEGAGSRDLLLIPGNHCISGMAEAGHSSVCNVALSLSLSLALFLCVCVRVCVCGAFDTAFAIITFAS